MFYIVNRVLLSSCYRLIPGQPGEAFKLTVYFFLLWTGCSSIWLKKDARRRQKLPGETSCFATRSSLVFGLFHFSSASASLPPPVRFPLPADCRRVSLIVPFLSPIPRAACPRVSPSVSTRSFYSFSYFWLCVRVRLNAVTSMKRTVRPLWLLDSPPLSMPGPPRPPSLIQFKVRSGGDRRVLCGSRS